MNFDRFLADLKQQAVAAGVSQRAMAEAAETGCHDTETASRSVVARGILPQWREF